MTVYAEGQEHTCPMVTIASVAESEDDDNQGQLDSIATQLRNTIKQPLWTGATPYTPFRVAAIIDSEIAQHTANYDLSFDIARLLLYQWITENDGAEVTPRVRSTVMWRTREILVATGLVFHSGACDAVRSERKHEEASQASSESSLVGGMAALGHNGRTHSTRALGNKICYLRIKASYSLCVCAACADASQQAAAMMQMQQQMMAMQEQLRQQQAPQCKLTHTSQRIRQCSCSVAHVLVLLLVCRCCCIF
jgi:hypothetical protein